jgi:hypothetical protein
MMLTGGFDFGITLLLLMLAGHTPNDASICILNTEASPLHL